MPCEIANSLNVSITEEEREKLHALAEGRDLSASTLIRHFVREAYAARFGAAPPRGSEPIATTRKKRAAR